MSRTLNLSVCLPKIATHTFDPQRPDDDFMGDGYLLIFKLPFAEN